MIMIIYTDRKEAHETKRTNLGGRYALLTKYAVENLPQGTADAVVITMRIFAADAIVTFTPQPQSPQIKGRSELRNDGDGLPPQVVVKKYNNKKKMKRPAANK